MIGRELQTRTPRITSTPSMPGQSEVEDHHVGPTIRRELQARVSPSGAVSTS